jgi:hypothetical protein
MRLRTINAEQMAAIITEIHEYMTNVMDSSPMAVVAIVESSIHEDAHWDDDAPVTTASILQAIDAWKATQQE